MEFSLTNVDVCKELVQSVAFAANIGILKEIQIQILYLLIEEGRYIIRVKLLEKVIIVSLIVFFLIHVQIL